MIVYSPWGRKELDMAEPLHCLSDGPLHRPSKQESHGAWECHLIMIGEGDEHCLLMGGLTNTT